MSRPRLTRTPAARVMIMIGGIACDIAPGPPRRRIIQIAAARRAGGPRPPPSPSPPRLFKFTFKLVTSQNLSGKGRSDQRQGPGCGFGPVPTESVESRTQEIQQISVEPGLCKPFATARHTLAAAGMAAMPPWVLATRPRLAAAINSR